MIRLLAALLLLTVSADTAQSIRLIDGDTFELDGETIRIWGIDAPEINGPCAYQADMAPRILNVFIGEKTISCELPPDRRQQDPDGASVRVCRADGDDLGAFMVGAGLAWDWPRYSNGAYGEHQQHAERSNFGVWRDGCRPDWWEGD